MVTDETARTGDEHSARGGPHVFIILPTLNEAENIGTLLDEIDRHLSRYRYTVCVVDDGSRDATVEVTRERMAQRPDRVTLLQREKDGPGCRRGSALYYGLSHAMRSERWDVFVELDGDLSHRPEELTTGIELVANGACNVSIASKYLPESQVIERTAHRRLLSRLDCIAARAVLDPRVTDYSNGYRFYDRRAAQVALSHRVRYGTPIYLAEVLALWLRQGLTVKEFPSTYIGRRAGSSKVVWRDVAEAAVALADIAWRYHVTGFEPRAQDSWTALPSRAER